MRTNKNMKKKQKKSARMSFLLVMVLIFAGTCFISCGDDKSKSAEDKESTKIEKTEEESKDKSDKDKPYYYNIENKERYDAYQQKNLEMDFDEVIWRVEADIDKPSYTETTEISREDENKLTTLVNKHFILRSDYEPAQLVELGGGYQVTPETKTAFDKMKADAAAEGLSLMYTSAYRTFAKQESLYSNYVANDGQENADTYSARPGSSEHHTGRAIDLVDETWDLMQFEYSDQCKWVSENCWKYGFILRYGEDIVDVTGYMYESWHITYVGEEAAKTMHEEGIESLEEYWVKYVKYSPEK